MSKIYSKSSFDRYGDDMCELVLGFLSIEDKVRFECVSKQFKRSVYQKQYDLTIDEKFFLKLKKSNPLGSEWTDLSAFRTHVKKLPSIKTLAIKYNTFWCKFTQFTQMVEMVIKYSEYLSTIKCNFIQISDVFVNKFLEKFGENLTTIWFFPQNKIYMNGIDYCVHNLRLCTNLCELRIFDLWLLFFGKTCLVKGLKKFSFWYFNQDADRFEKFIDLNRTGLEAFEIIFPPSIAPTPLINCMEQLKKLSNLRELKIIFTDYYDFSIVRSLEEIALNCLRLERLELEFFAETVSSNLQILNAIKNFKQLKRLYMCLNSGFASDDSFFMCESLAECRHLTHLTLRTNQTIINDKFFSDIDIHLPKLRYLEVRNTNINGSAFDSIAFLKNLTELYLSASESKQIMESRVYDLIESCPSIKVIELDNFETLDNEDVESLLATDGKNEEEKPEPESDQSIKN